MAILLPPSRILLLPWRSRSSTTRQRNCFLVSGTCKPNGRNLCAHDSWTESADLVPQLQPLAGLATRRNCGRLRPPSNLRKSVESGTLLSVTDTELIRGKKSSSAPRLCALVAPGVVSTASGFWAQSSPAMYDLLASLITLCGAVTFLQIFNELAKRDVLDKKLSRKLVHIGVGLGFMLFWPLFTNARQACYLAAFTPAANTLRLLAIGLGLLKNDAIVKAMSREGDHRELLRGPFYYGVAVVVTTVCFWRSSPIGIVALANLCAGDGFADIIGRNFGNTKLPYNKDKSYAGSLGFFIMSSLVSILYLKYFAAFGFLKILPGTVAGILLVSFLTAWVESLPISTRLDDNLTVPFTAICFGMFLLPSS